MCNLSKCKGACCVEGDAGAPLEEEELGTIDELAEHVKPMLRPEAIEALDKQGNYTVDSNDGGWVTTLVDEKECAFVIFEEDGSTRCSFEKLYLEGKSTFRKPVSCQLYPVRITRYREFDAVNYDRWDICSSACELGKENGVKVYEFVKDALIRKYGEAWYEGLKRADELRGKI